MTGKTSGHEYLLRASHSKLLTIAQGFLAVYQEAKNEDARAEDEEEDVRISARGGGGAKAGFGAPHPRQHFTQPPPRFSEASLVKALEENGIGRPSTYAPTISTIQQRGYVVREEKQADPNRYWHSGQRLDGAVFS